MSLLLPTGQNLAEQLTPVDQRLLSSAEQTLGIDPALISRLRPAVAAQLILRLAFTRAGVPPGPGVEPVLELRAKARGAPINGLETPDPAVLKELSFRPEDGGIDTLRKAMNDDPKIAEARARIVALWESADLPAIARACQDGMTPKLHTELVTLRNKVFAKRIVERMRAPGTIFVAIGVCHLAGTDSIIPLLQSSGVTVERR